VLLGQPTELRNAERNPQIRLASPLSRKWIGGQGNWINDKGR
jgi:hypothetical protein